MDLILASASPRRLELLSQIGVHPLVIPAQIDESVLAGEGSNDYVLRLAQEKANRVFVALPKGLKLTSVCLGSDTSVILDNQILGKPQDREESRMMLRALSGRAHQVVTAIAIAGEFGVISQLVATDVWFRTLSEQQIDAYWYTGEPQDKAGSYGIQGFGAVFVERIEGSYSAVVGLPLTETAELLDQVGVPIWRAPEQN